MKILKVLLFATVALAYLTQSQLEILDLHYSIQPKNGEQRTFYDILQVKSNVDSVNLEKSFKKLSRKYHPDKYISKPKKEKSKAERKFQTLGLAIGILRDVEKRKNYDYFIKNGFPKWNEKKHQYVFGNRFQPTFKFIAIVLIVLTSIGQYLFLKLNQIQNNKRIDKILRDVKWKADNIKDESKIIELPENMISTDYSFDDKIVTYCDKVFLVKADSTILIYNDKIDVNNQTEMNQLIKSLLNSGKFNLFGFQKKELNRKERRAKKIDDDTEEDNNVLEKLVEFKRDDVQVSIFDLYIFKWISGFFKRGEKTAKEENEVVSNNKLDEEDAKQEKPENIVISKENDKLVLPNGKVLHKRKK